MKLTPAKLRILLAQNGVFIAMVVVALLFGAINPRFLSPKNLLTILQQVTELGVMALPFAFVVMVGCIDLSVGSIASMAAILAGLTMTSTGSITLGIAAGLVFGLLAGAVNGILVSYFNLNPFVVTLGFLSVWGGMALFLTDGKTVTKLPEAFTKFGSAKLGGVNVQIIVLAIVVAAAWYVLNRTAKGKEILAVGGNKKASYLMGINVRATKLQVLAVSGVFAAATGLMLTAKLGAATPTVGSGMELTALTVVLLGGVAFEGGAGRISGVVAGLLFVGVLQNGLVILGVSAYLKTVFTGAVLVIAVLMDSSIQRVVRTAWKQNIRRPGSPAPAAAGPADPVLTPGAAAPEPADSAEAADGVTADELEEVRA